MFVSPFQTWYHPTIFTKADLNVKINRSACAFYRLESKAVLTAPGIRVPQPQYPPQRKQRGRQKCSV